MKKYIAVLSISLALNATTSIFAAGDIAKGKAKAVACMACHGADGNGVSAKPEIPKLAGQNIDYIVKQLKDFKSRKRSDQWCLKAKKGEKHTACKVGNKNDRNSEYGVWPGTMNAMVLGLSEADMVNIAAYFASQTLKPGLAIENLKALGKKIYVGGNKLTGVPACIGCHGPAGQGNNSALYPALAGQNAAYTEAQITHFRTAGLSWLAHKNASKAIPENRAGRKNDKDYRMQTVVLRITDAEIKAVASYLQGLRLNK